MQLLSTVRSKVGVFLLDLMLEPILPLPNALIARLVFFST